MKVPQSDTTEPYVHVVRTADAVVVRGAKSYRVGHRLPRPAGSQDDGIFLEWEWRDGQLSVCNDRFGFHPCYYHADAAGISVSPSIPALLAAGAPSDFDDEALAVFTRLGFYLDDATPFRGVRALPPGARLTWADGHLSIAVRETRAAVRPPLSRAAALDAYAEAFDAAIRRRIQRNARTCVPLSGGRDSRHIVLALWEAGASPDWCVSYAHYPPRRNADAEIAARLSARLGIPHVSLQQTVSRLRAEFRKNRETSFCSDEHVQVLALADHVRGRADVLYDGIGGDVLSNGLFLDPGRLELMDAGQFEELARLLLANHDARAAVLLPDTARRFGIEAAIAAVARELARHADAPNPIGSFFFWNRTRREIALAPYSLLRDVPDVFAPYLDHDVFDLLASLPVSLLVARDFHTEAIARSYPQFADVPYAPKGTYTTEDRWAVRRFAADAALYAASGAPSRLVRRSFVLPRLARAALDGDYTKLEWFGPVQAIYLLQLERLVNGLTSEASQPAGHADEIHHMRLPRHV